jgi:hypothetical protein
MYQVVIVPMPAIPADVQKLINTTVPAGSNLISAAVFTNQGTLQIMIVYK